MNQKVSDRIKILGFFMTCFMVFYHCGSVGNSNTFGAFDASCNSFLNYIFNTMGMVVMSHFFAVTGFLLFYHLNMKNYSSKIKRRVFSLLIPYVMWQIIIAIKYVLQNEYTFSIKNFIYRTFYLVTWPIDGPMWYVYAIFLLALISPVFLLMFKNKKVGWCMVLIIIVFLRAQGKFNIPVFTRIANHGYVGNIIWYFPSYLVGAFYGRFYDELNEEKSLVYVLSLLFLACLLQGVLPGIFYDITIRMMPIMSLFLLPVIPSLKDKWVYRLTFLMYAMHQPLIADVKPHINNLYKVVLMPDSVRNILTRVIILAIDIALAAAIYIVLKKFAPKGLNALTGSRD